MSEDKDFLLKEILQAHSVGMATMYAFIVGKWDITSEIVRTGRIDGIMRAKDGIKHLSSVSKRYKDGSRKRAGYLFHPGYGIEK